MSDYAVDIKIRNARIRRAIRDRGYKNVAQFCKAHGLHQYEVGALLNLKTPPMNILGQWRPAVIRMCDALMMAPDDLFSDAQRTVSLKSNGKTIEMTEAQVRRIAGSGFEEIKRLQAPEVEPDRQIESEELQAGITEALSILGERYKVVLSARFGLDGNAPKTLDQIAEEHGVSRERIRQMEQRALLTIRTANAKGRLPTLDGVS